MLKTAFRCIRNAAVNTIIKHDGIEHAGYLAFLGLLALFPFLVFIVAIIGVIGQGQTGAALISTLLENLPYNITAALRPRIEEIISGPPQGLLTISIIGAIWTSSSAVEGLRTVLNRAYHVETPPAYLFRRMLSILQLMFFAFILVLIMLSQLFIPLVWHHIAVIIGATEANDYKLLWGAISSYLTPLVLFVIVSFLYYLLPNIKQRLVSVVPGAAMVVVLVMWTAYLFTLYLSKFDQVNLIYGSLGGIIAVLVFAYLCNIIFIFGAELNYQIVKLIGMRVEEREKVTEPPLL